MHRKRPESARGSLYLGPQGQAVHKGTKPRFKPSNPRRGHRIAGEDRKPFFEADRSLMAVCTRVNNAHPKALGQPLIKPVI